MCDTFNVLCDVFAERKKQRGKGFTEQHDDKHKKFQLTEAAIAYCLATVNAQNFQGFKVNLGAAVPTAVWPWKLTEWNPKDTKQNLLRAAALIVAELERIKRIEQVEQ
jgi:hypothetical protein